MSEADDSFGEFLGHLGNWVDTRRQWWECRDHAYERALEKRLHSYEAEVAGALRRYVLAVVREEAE